MDSDWDPVLRRAFAGDAVPPDSARSRRPTCGRLELRQELARGGAGVVWLAFDPKLGRDVAVKSVLPDDPGNPELVHRFMAEARIGGQLQHPGIVPVHDVGLDSNDHPYFSMKLVQGDDLGKCLARRTSPGDELPRWIEVFQRVCETIAYAHSRDIVHRDLKPANVMIGAFGEVQVVDWGFARHLVEAPSSGPSDTAGTPGYLPPEQSVDAPGDTDRRTDVFGLGAILFHILTGRPPCGRAQQRQDIARSLKDIGTALDQPWIEPHLAQLTARCLSPSPDERPSDAAELAADVVGYRESVEDRAARDRIAAAEAAARLQSERRARSRLLVAIGVAMFALSGLLAIRAELRIEAERRQQGIRFAHRQALRLAQNGDSRTAQVLIAQAIAIAKTERLDDLLPTLQNDAYGIELQVRDDQFERRLLVIRSDSAPADRLERDLESALRDYGAPLDLPPEAFHDRLTAMRSRLSLEIARTLEQIALRYDPDPSPTRASDRLLRLADAADANPSRRNVRRLARAGDVRRLIAMTEPHMSTQDVATDYLLALALSRLHESASASQVLHRLEESHPDDLWIHATLAELYQRPPLRDSVRAEEHATRAEQLHPIVGWTIRRATSTEHHFPNPIDRPEPPSSILEHIATLIAERHYARLVRVVETATEAQRSSTDFRALVELAIRDAQAIDPQRAAQLEALLR